jgi:hypothetical protein
VISAEIYPSMVDAKQLETRDFILVSAGAVCPAVVCLRHYIALHRGACSGAATSEAGEEAWPPSPKRSDWGDCQYRERRSARAKCVVISVVRVLCPCGEGDHLPFIDQGEGDLQACRTV